VVARTVLLIRGAMGVPGNRRWSVLGTLVACVAVWLGACDLNPQPLPPAGFGESGDASSGTPTAGASSSGGGAATGTSGSSSGSSSGGAFAAPDATAINGGSADAGVVDSSMDAGEPPEAAALEPDSASDASDASDTGSATSPDASLDAPAE